MKNASRRTLITLAALAAFGCGGDTITQPPQPLVVSLQPGALSVFVGGAGQLSVSASRGGVPVGEVFNFSVDKLAVATVSTAGTVFGVSPGTAIVTATATSSGEKATAIVTVNSAPPSAIEKTSGDVQNAVSGNAVLIPPSVTVRNQFGQGVPGVAVTFAVQSGGGTITGASQTTNANGVATVGSWVLGTVGINTLAASVTGIGAVTFIATSSPIRGAITLANSTASFSGVLAGPNPGTRTIGITEIGGTVGTLSVGTIGYDASASGWLSAQLTSSTAPANVVLTPNTNGLALGTYTATVPIVGTQATNNPQVITVTLNITATRALQLVVAQQPGGAVAGSTLNPQPVIEVRDGNGALASDITDPVTVALVNNAGGVTGTTTVNAVAGVATFTNLSVNAAGDYNLAFTSPNAAGVTSNTFTVTNAGQGNPTISISVGNSATATVTSGTNITIPITVDVGTAPGGLGLLAFTFTFDPTKFDFQGGLSGSFGTAPAFQVSTANVATGSLTVSVTDAQGIPSGAATVYSITLKAKAPASASPVTINVTSAATTTGAPIQAGNLVVRPLAVTVP